MVEIFITSVLCLLVILLSLYKKRYKGLMLFLGLELIIIIPSFLYEGNAYRMHIAIFGTLAIYLILIIFLIYFSIVKKDDNKHQEVHEMNLVNYPIFESSLVLFETEQGEFAGVFEDEKVLVKLNEEYPNENTKYSVYFLNACIGLDELPTCWEINYR